MFEFIRTHQRLMQFMLLLIIVPAFAIGFGLQGWNVTGDPNAVAKVCGGTVTMQDFERAQQEYLGNMRAQLGANFRPEFFDNAEARGSILDRLVNQRALACAALKRNIVASDELLRQNILHDSKFQSEGKFSNELYQGVLMSSGLTPAGYETLLRQQLAMQALSGGVLMTASAPQAVQTLFASAQQEQREVQDLLLKPEAYTAQVKLAPEAAKKYYDANQKEFQVPPQLRAEYLLLSVDTLSASITPDAAEVRKYYDQNQNRYGISEEREGRHILIPVTATAPAAEIAAARAKAEGILAQLKADPNKFPQLAKEFSKDPGSAEKGGDLGFMGRGAFVKPFEDKLFALKQGEISDLVQSEFGFHIIQLMAIKPSSVKPFEQVRAEIETEWKKQRAKKLYADSVDGFADIVYTQPDSLKPAADKYKLTVQSTPLFARGTPPKELNNPNLMNKLFGDEAVKNKRNTEAVEVAPGTMVSARVAEYKPQSVRPFAEAEAGITAMLTQREARTLAKKDGEAKLKAAQASPDAVTFGAAKTISRAKPEGFADDALKMVMGAPKGSKLPAVVGGELADGSYAVYRINKVSQPEKPDPALATSIKSTLERSQAESDFNAYLAALKLTAKIELHPENLEKKPGN